MSRHPTLRWAQTSNKLFITIYMPDAEDVNLKLEPEGRFSFSAISGTEKIPYEVDIDLYDKVDVNESKASIGLRNIQYSIVKAEEKWWNRLLKQEGKIPGFVKIDWDKWIDEDEENASENTDYIDEMEVTTELDFSKLGMDAGEGDDDDDKGDDNKEDGKGDDNEEDDNEEDDKEDNDDDNEDDEEEDNDDDDEDDDDDNEEDDDKGGDNKDNDGDNKDDDDDKGGDTKDDDDGDNEGERIDRKPLGEPVKT